MADVQSKKTILDVAEYRETPDTFMEPTQDELKARTRRNIALALALGLFMVFVFVTMITRAGGAA